jgi:hypothetical protein
MKPPNTNRPIAQQKVEQRREPSDQRAHRLARFGMPDWRPAGCEPRAETPVAAIIKTIWAIPIQFMLTPNPLQA